MATSFMSNLRRMKPLQPWADDGSIKAGESDPYDWGRDLIERDRRAEMAGPDPVPMRRGNISRMGAGMSNPDWLDSAGSNGRMNVVYDQGPEMFQKQLNFQKDMAAQAQKNLEQKRLVDSLAANDDYIDNRRKFETATRLAERPNYSFESVAGGNIVGLDPRTGKVLDTGVSSGTLSDADKLKAAGAERHAQLTQQGINQWIAAREAAQAKRDAAEEAGNAKRDAERIQSQAKIDAMNTPEARMKDTTAKLAEVAIMNPELAGAITWDDKGLRLNPDAPEEVRRALAAKLYGSNNVTNVAGVGSAGLGGQLGAAGLRNNAPIDQNATATPYAANKSNTAAFQGGGGQVMRKTQKNAKTGATRIVVSRDGGQTWQPK